ncbi:MAG: LamG-like jellyroll fold domain-containing protein, partial [Candidatus Nanohalobium sp.]
GWIQETPVNRPTVKDYSTNSHLGTFYGGNNGELKNFDFNVSSGWTSGKIGEHSLELDGRNDYVQVSDTNVLDINGGLTVTFWSKNSEGGQNVIPIGKDGVYRFWFSGNSWYFRVNNESGNRLSSGYSSATTKEGEWDFVVGMYEPDQQEVSIWVDGSKEASVYGSNFGSNLQSNSQPFEIGGGISAWGDAYFNGSFDDVRIYERALSKSKIKSLYQGESVTKGLVGRWNFEAGDRKTAYDTSNLIGDGILGTNSGRFSGNSTIKVIGSSRMNITGEFTLSAWAKMSENISVKLESTTDNIEDVYIDGNLLWSNSDWADRTNGTFSLDPGRHVLAYRADNLGGPASMISSLKWPNGSVIFNSQESGAWKYTKDKPSNNWKTVGYDTGKWKTLQKTADYGNTSAWNGITGWEDTKADWMWSNEAAEESASGDPIWIRREFTVGQILTKAGAYSLTPNSGTVNGNSVDLSEPRSRRHVTMVYNGTHQLLYLGSERLQTEIAERGSENTQNLVIAKQFTGKIDEVRIYNRSLSQKEIQRLAFR